MATQADIRQRVTDQIITALKNGTSPWRKPWSPASNTGSPANIVSKKRYTGINPLLLHLASMKWKFQSKWWGTFQQWSSLGCAVKKRPDDVEPGAWGTKIVFFKQVSKVTTNGDGEEEQKRFPLLREFTVFNADQVEKAERFQVNVNPTPAEPDFEPAEEVIAATQADIRHFAGDHARYFRPPADYIEMPLKQQFINGLGFPAYYDTLFHELCHWSESRLGWKDSDNMDHKARYALAELRAEMGAAFLSTEIGIPSLETNDNHARYLNCWIQAMKEDYRVIFRISSAASAAADFVLGFSRKEAMAGA